MRTRSVWYVAATTTACLCMGLGSWAYAQIPADPTGDESGQPRDGGPRSVCAGDIDINGAGTSGQNLLFGTANSDCRTTSMYYASEFACTGGQITGMRYYVSTRPGTSMSAFMIRMRHTANTQYPSGTGFDNTGWTTVYGPTTLSRPAGTGWLTITFDTAFSYNGTDNLEVDVTFNNGSASTDGQVWCFQPTTAYYRTTYKRCTNCLCPSSTGPTNPADWGADCTGSKAFYVPRAQFIFAIPDSACCLYDGFCQILSQSACAAQGGTFNVGMACASVTCPSRFAYFDFETDPGWSVAGDWQWGAPGGLGGDPAAAHSGTNVYGYDLTIDGQYSDGISQTNLTTTAINCMGKMDIVLHFWRWLGIQSSTYDHASIQVSNDNTNWTTVWNHTGTTTFTDSAWTKFIYPLPNSVVMNQPTVYLRWGMGPTDNLLHYCGWNIDDVELRGVATPAQGACCNGANCTITTPQGCASPGVYRGDGTLCTPNPCTGACCFSDGNCELLTQAACTGVYHGDGTTCGTVSCPQPGVNCVLPYAVSLTPGFGSLILTNQTTCGKVNDYSSTCLGVYDGGEDTLYAITVTAAVNVSITLDPKGMTFTGFVLDDTCPPGGTDCLIVKTQYGSTPSACTHLDPGVYYLMVDNQPTPNCIPTYDLTFAECTPPTGRCCYGSGPSCADNFEYQCLALDGTWEGTTTCAAIPCPVTIVPGEACWAAYDVASLPFSAEFDNDLFTADGPPGSCNYSGATVLQNDAWLKYTAPSSRLVNLTVMTRPYDGVIVVYSGPDCDNLTPLTCIDSPDDPAVWSGVATAGTTYWFQVGDWGGTEGGGLTQFALIASSGPGACCAHSGGCYPSTVVDPGDCLPGDAYLGDGTTCNPNLCPQPGGCCAADGSCYLSTLTAPGNCAPGDTYQGDNTACTPNTCPQPGAVCEFPTPVSLTPGFGSLTKAGQTTCGKGNDYADTCLGNYDDGEDTVYRITVIGTVDVSITLDPKTTQFTGFALSDTCPPGGTGCLIVKTQNAAAPATSLCTRLVPGVYYLMVDTFPNPTCIPSYDLTFTECVLPLGRCCHGTGPTCVDNHQYECNALGGTWDVAKTCAANPCPQAIVAGEMCDAAYAISGPRFGGLFDNDWYAPDGPHATCDPYYPTTSGFMQNDAWLAYTAVSDCSLTVTASGPYDIVMTVRSDCTALTQLYCADAGMSVPETISFTPAAGTTYYFQVGDVGNLEGGGLTEFSLVEVLKGACCTDTTCSVVCETHCAALSGTFLGNGTACTPNPCQAGCSMMGDMSGGGLLNGLDIQGFVDCALGGGTNCACGDYSGNGVVDLADVPDFAAALLAP